MIFAKKDRLTGKAPLSWERIISQLTVLTGILIPIAIQAGWISGEAGGAITDALKETWPVLIPLGSLWWRWRVVRDKL